MNKYYTITIAILFSITSFAQHRPIEQVTIKYKLRGAVSAAVSHSAYRSIDGTNNNIDVNKAEWGASDIQLFREIAPDYGDGKNSMAGANRPSARKISNVVVEDFGENQLSFKELSAFNYVWGQFIDHDLTLTAGANSESEPIVLPPDEQIFTENIPFTRSKVFPGTGTRTPRQQINLTTSWLDASMVYGNNDADADWLRSHVNGKMKVSEGNLLPYNTTHGQADEDPDPNAPNMADDNGHTVVTFAAGDPRASEHPGILSMHTLFVREHNRQCDLLLAQGLTDDETIYQQARRQVIAIINNITYGEFLPGLGLKLVKYKGYKSKSRPDILNTFATAAYRIGHTMVADEVLMLDNQCDAVGDGVVPLADAFFNHQLIAQHGIDPFIKGIASNTQYQTDIHITTDLRNFLVVDGGQTRSGIDLASLNIQRGRDHGLPDYNTLRAFYTHTIAKDFSDVTDTIITRQGLEELYPNINDVDPWVGMLSENRLPGKSVGPTMYALIRSQFSKIRDGDYYFYLNDPGFTDAQRTEIAKTKLVDVIKRNTNITNIKRNPFIADVCSDLDDDDKVAAKPLPSTLNISPSTAKLYPNPTEGLINIELGTGIHNVRVLSTTGAVLQKHVLSGKVIHVDISRQPHGIYFIQIITGKEIKTFKIVKI